MINIRLQWPNEQQFVVEANREHYQQLVSERQVEFKQAFIPTSVNAENSLVDEEGNAVEVCVAFEVSG